MRLKTRLANRLGALPARHVTWGLVLIFSTWVLADVLLFRLTGGLALSSYDLMVRSRLVAAAPDARIVIVDIDEASLQRMGREFGRWPWPRDTLATVLQHIESQQPAAIIWDMVFSDADRLNPGGDAAFNAAVGRSTHSHFAVVRLPAANDASSQVTRAVLPGLWITPAAPSANGAPTPLATLAVIAPALPALAGARLGTNNGYADRDGVLRRYRSAEVLADGSAIQSIATSALASVDPPAWNRYAQRLATGAVQHNALIAWRLKAEAYPRVPFADVFASAEGAATGTVASSFRGKVVIIGSTAPSLHDMHPTPLSPAQPGVDTLATVVDNALNDRGLAELPRWLQALLAISLCAGMAVWVQFNGVKSLAPALVPLPAGLLALSFLSLNGSPVFLDLNLAAGLALLFLAMLGFWRGLRQDRWCTPPRASSQPLAVWAWERRGAWTDAPLERLIDALERHAPQCRVVVCDTNAAHVGDLRWPELARWVAIVGPPEAMTAAHHVLRPALARLAHRDAAITVLDTTPNRENLAKQVLGAWASLQKADTPLELVRK